MMTRVFDLTDGKKVLGTFWGEDVALQTALILNALKKRKHHVEERFTK